MSAPAFTVVVPTYNRPAQIRTCLEALGRLRPPEAGYEICIVNDGGMPPPDDAIEAARRAGRARSVRVLTHANRGPGQSRNAGAEAATGEHLAFTDDDCRPAEDWLIAMESALRTHPHGLIGGRTINALPRNLCSTASQALVDFVTSYFDGGPQGRFFASCNLAVSRAAFLDSGGFDDRFTFCAGEDREFADRWWEQRRPSIRAPQAVVYHAHLLTLAGLGRQHFTYGRGAVAFRRLRAERGRPQPLDPRFYVESLRYPFRNEPPLRAAAIALLTTVAHGAYFAGMFSERSRAGSGLNDGLPGRPGNRTLTPS